MDREKPCTVLTTFILRCPMHSIPQAQVESPALTEEPQSPYHRNFQRVWRPCGWSSVWWKFPAVSEGLRRGNWAWSFQCFLLLLIILFLMCPVPGAATGTGNGLQYPSRSLSFAFTAQDSLKAATV
jgi:hypothetical protein